MYSYRIKILRICGTDFRLGPGWALFAALVIWTLSHQLFPILYPGHANMMYLVMGLAGLIGVLVSQVSHRVAQCLIAGANGVGMPEVTLLPIGGQTDPIPTPKSANALIRIALAGPLAGVTLGATFWVAMILMSNLTTSTVAIEAPAFLAVANLGLAAVALIPALPLDGGNILRAVLWQRHQNISAATTTAAKSGVVIGHVLTSCGVVAVFMGAMTIGIWGIALGVQMQTAARAITQRCDQSNAKPDFRVLDKMQPNPIVADPDMTLAEFVDRIVLGQGLSFVPVVEQGELIGHMDQQVLLDIDREYWTSTRVGDVFTGMDASTIVRPDLTIQDLMTVITNTGRRKFLVVDDDDLVGIIALADLTGLLQPRALLGRDGGGGSFGPHRSD